MTHQITYNYVAFNRTHVHSRWWWQRQYYSIHSFRIQHGLRPNRIVQKFNVKRWRYVCDCFYSKISCQLKLNAVESSCHIECRTRVRLCMWSTAILFISALLLLFMLSAFPILPAVSIKSQCDYRIHFRDWSHRSWKHTHPDRERERANWEGATALPLQMSHFIFGT